MREYAELNIESGMPFADDAMRHLKSGLEQLRKQKCKCVLVIHGYGSTGKGGKIGVRARKWLMAEKEAGKVKQVIFGENFELFNFDALALKNRYKDLAPLLEVCNHGVTVVEL